MELYEHRIVNGILKSVNTITGPQQAYALLSQDIEIIADAERSNIDDLWPSIWALAGVLCRQFTGRIFIRCGLKEALAAPAELSSDCVFTSNPIPNVLKIGLGIQPGSDDGSQIWGDARGTTISYGHGLTGSQQAHPISCFALAGYLGFAALATAVGIPGNKEDYIVDELVLPFSANESYAHPKDGLAFLGIGQLGQAYLAALYFMLFGTGGNPNVLLVDKDYFEKANWCTQILLGEHDWEHKPKTDFLAAVLSQWGWNVTTETTAISWGWKRLAHHPRLALLGFDNFDARRIAIEAGYDWLFEAGIGTSFLSPRITWHSLPPERRMGFLFPRSENLRPTSVNVQSEFFKTLQENTPGGCGWVTFENISSTAPSMGLVATAFLWAEVLRYLQGDRHPIEGYASLWSPLLPAYRTIIPKN
jgi:hypothetical protein